MSDFSKQTPITVGWREWAGLPELGVPAIKVKIDTGARTSALHAVNIERKRQGGTDVVAFSIQPLQRNNKILIRAEAPLVDIRSVSDSGGHAENRFVVRSCIELGGMTEEIDISLTERHSMLFRMLIGRTALAGNVFVDPSASYLCGRKSARLLYATQIESQS